MDIYRTQIKSVFSLIHEGKANQAYMMLQKLLEFSTSEEEKKRFENIYDLYFTPQGTLNKINKKLRAFVQRINFHRNSAGDESAHIGINVGHNATISVVQRGGVVFLQSEERLSRQKMHIGFPFKTLEALKADLSSTKIGSITFHGCTNSTLKFLVDEQRSGASGRYGTYLDSKSVNETISFFRNNSNEALSNINSIQSAQLFATECDANIRRAGRDYLSSLFSEFQGKKTFNFVPHHLCHAMSVIPFLPDSVDITQDQLAIFTLDAEGDFFSGSAFLVNDGKFQLIEHIPAVFSIGNIVHYATGILGMRMGEHEYKLMGLAPYANQKDSERIAKKLRDIVDFDEERDWVSSWNFQSRSIAESPWQMRAVIDTLFDTFMCERFDNVAGGLQTYLEEIVVRWISAIASKLDASNIALAGGVFANVKLNQKIRQLPFVKSLAITPSPGDESGAIGASIIGNLCAGGFTPKRTSNIYLGHASADSSIVDALKLADDNSLLVEPIKSEAEKVSRLLELGEVVGRAVGPMEFGQRALGNRSILANPSYPGVPEKINHSIKNRDFWMPFAPTIIHPYHEKLIYDDEKYTSAFMMIGQDVRPSAIHWIRNASHPRDFTARPQILKRSDNVDYYDIILAFFEKTGIPAVLNTSFNLHGEPIVADAFNAVDVFLKSSLKYLVIDGYFIEKPKAQPLKI